jgi:hypothetical protein
MKANQVLAKKNLQKNNKGEQNDNFWKISTKIKEGTLILARSKSIKTCSN